MPKVGALVKPATRGRDPWRLGRVEQVHEDGRCVVRAYVAPAGAYEGSAAVYRPDELAVVPLADVVAYLVRLRAEIVSRQQVERQVVEALRVVERDLTQCACGGTPGQHGERCLLARALDGAVT